MWNKIKSDFDIAMTNFTKSGNHNSSFTAVAMKNMATLQGGQNEGEESVSSSSSNNNIEEDPDGVAERGFSHFTRSLPVIYLRQWLNKKPEHTNFCSRKLPAAAQLDSLSTAASGTMRTPAPTTATGKRKSSSKNKNKDILVELVTELKDRRGNNSISFGLTKSPETK
jgi:hypothetical protein